MTYEIVSERKLRTAVRLTVPEDAYAVVKRYAKAKREQFILLTLNGAHEIITVVIVSIGLVNRTVVHPREVFIRAIKDAATAVILCHNHPSGHLDPSTEDIEITSRLVQAGELLGIPVLDHIIITKSGYTSLKHRGFIA